MNLFKLFLLPFLIHNEVETTYEGINWEQYTPPPPVVEELIQPPLQPQTEAAPEKPKIEPNPALDKDMLNRAFFGNAAEVKDLLEQGGRVAAVNEKGETPLILAAKRGNSEGFGVILALVEAGADVDSKDAQGETALFHAARAGSLEAVQLLLESGTHYYWTNNTGEIARTYAFRGDHTKVFAAMDKFVLDSNEKTRRAAEASRRLAEARRKAIDEKELPPPPPIDRVKQAAVAREAALSGCLYQYWFYVSEAGQKTEFTREQLDKKMAEYKGTNNIMVAALVKELQFPNNSADQLQLASSKSIFDELQRMGSNINRNAKGVGTDTDASERCKKTTSSIIEPMLK